MKTGSDLEGHSKSEFPTIPKTVQNGRHYVKNFGSLMTRECKKGPIHNLNSETFKFRMVAEFVCLVCAPLTVFTSVQMFVKSVPPGWRDAIDG